MSRWTYAGKVNQLELRVTTLRRLLDSIHAGVVVIDAENDIVFFNRLAGEMFGQNSERRIGTSILLCHPERAEPGVLKMIE